MVELSVDQEGRVTSVTSLRTTPPFTDGVVRVGDVQVFRSVPSFND